MYRVYLSFTYLKSYKYFNILNILFASIYRGKLLVFKRQEFYDATRMFMGQFNGFKNPSKI